MRPSDARSAPCVPEAARLDDPAAFARLVSPLLPELRRAARRAGASAADTDDALQEALLRAWAFRHGFRAGTNARAWLHTIVRNTTISRHRRGARERVGLERFRADPAVDVLGAGAPEPGADDGLGDELRAALAGLPADFARVVELVDLRGLAYREAADALGCPLGTVMSRLHRGRRALRRALACTDALPVAA